MTRSAAESWGGGSSSLNSVGVRVLASKPTYSKPFLTTSQQLDLMVSRGIRVQDRHSATLALQAIGYYRLSGYWYPFRSRPAGHREGIDTPLDTMREEIEFEDLVALAEFDRRLRNIILAATEPFETAIRVSVARTVGETNPTAYLDRAYWGKAGDAVVPGLPAQTTFAAFAARHEALVATSKEAFASHFREQYDGSMPIWMAIELWDFGMLSRFYQVIPTADRASVSAAFGANGGRQLQGWLVAINDLRNVCAHHSRLNRRHFPNAPSIPKNASRLQHLASLSDKDRHRLYPLLCVLAHVLENIPGCSGWKESVREHFVASPRILLRDDGDYGMPSGWFEMELWNS